MSTDFIALFDLSSADITLEWLKEQLVAEPQFGRWIVERYRNKWLVKDWEIQESEITGSTLFGPGGFAIRLEPQTMDVYHMMRFNTFTGDTLFRLELRNACFQLARMVESDRAIYTHELMPYRSGGLVQIEKRLRDEIGPPANNFEELHAAEYYGPRAWYIEDFRDLV